MHNFFFKFQKIPSMLLSTTLTMLEMTSMMEKIFQNLWSHPQLMIVELNVPKSQIALDFLGVICTELDLKEIVGWNLPCLKIPRWLWNTLFLDSNRKLIVNIYPLFTFSTVCLLFIYTKALGHVMKERFCAAMDLVCQLMIMKLDVTIIAMLNVPKKNTFVLEKLEIVLNQIFAFIKKVLST